MENLYLNLKEKWSVKLLTCAFLLTLSTSSCAMSQPLSHKSDINKLFVKCQPKHMKMAGFDFNYRKAFCYQWKEEVKDGLKTKEVWKVRVYDVEDYHYMFVDMGVIGRIHTNL